MHHYYTRGKKEIKVWEDCMNIV